MKTLIRTLAQTSTKIPLLVAALALVLAASGGAVAGKMITGKQIKDNTVTTKDIKNKTLTIGDFAKKTKKKLKGAKGATGPAGPAGQDALTGYELKNGTASIPANTPVSGMTVFCPEGKVVLNAFSYWQNSPDAVQVVVWFDGDGIHGASVYSPGVPTDDTLYIDVNCVTLADGAPEPAFRPAAKNAR